eukprot:COSAG05_NODE_1235_length_5438_cov_19.332272_5_plen_91_part_00
MRALLDTLSLWDSNAQRRIRKMDSLDLQCNMHQKGITSNRTPVHRHQTEIEIENSLVIDADLTAINSVSAVYEPDFKDTQHKKYHVTNSP